LTWSGVAMLSRGMETPWTSRRKRAIDGKSRIASAEGYA
jgi:hypothetical protein